MSIGQLARELGIRTSAIRYYEQIGVLPKPPRASGRRVYTRRDLDILRVVHAGRTLGFRLADMRELVSALAHSARPSERFRKSIRQRLRELDELTRQAAAMRGILQISLRCRRLHLERCVRLLGGT